MTRNEPRNQEVPMSDIGYKMLVWGDNILAGADWEEFQLVVR